MKNSTKRQPVYGIAGDGKLAKHLLRYLALLQLPCRHWARKKSLHPPRRALAECTHIIIAISDDALEPFIRENFPGSVAVLVHCSGALHTPLAHGAHPLAVLGKKPLSLAEYKQIPFIIETAGPAFKKLLPGLPNPNYRIAPTDKALYHALCVLSANFSALLWARFFTGAAKLGIPKTAALAYFNSSAENIAGDCTVTGPLARADKKTVNKNIAALRGDAFQNIYRAFAKNCAGRTK